VTSAASSSGGFPGFPRGARAIAIPALFFSALLPAIDEPAELLVTLYAFYALSRKRGYPRFLQRAELLADSVLAQALARLDDPQEALGRGLALATERGSLLRLAFPGDGQAAELFFLNTPADRRALELVRTGRIMVAEATPPPSAPKLVSTAKPAPAPVATNIFALYEDNIGPMTPLIAEELLAAEERYPKPWIEAAMRLAVGLNKRNWRYIQGILRRWMVEGPDYEEVGRDPQAPGPRRPLSGKYRRLVGR